MKFVSFFNVDLYRRSRFIESNFVWVENDIVNVKSWKVDRLIDKRVIAREIKYLIRWKRYNSKHDVWRNLSKLNDVINLVDDYERFVRKTITLLDRLQLKISSHMSINQRQLKMLFHSSIKQQSLVDFIQFNQQLFIDQRFVVMIFKRFTKFTFIELIETYTSFTS